jgi:hypothetical protein
MAADAPGGDQGTADPELDGHVLVHEGRVDQDLEGQDDDQHRPEGEPEGDQPLGDREAPGRSWWAVSRARLVAANSRPGR